jgi:hypothetical protein
MAVSEALVGQVFVVVLVARLVAAYVPGMGEVRRQTLARAHASRNSDGAKGVDQKADRTDESLDQAVDRASADRD